MYVRISIVALNFDAKKHDSEVDVLTSILLTVYRF